MKILARIAAALSLSLALIASPLKADGRTPAAAAVEKANDARPALWKAADKDTTIYLFGTVHVLPSGIDWLNGGIAKAFDASDELVTEIVPPDPARMQRLVIEKALLPQGRTLRAMLTEDKRAALEAALADLGLPAAAFDPFEPWYAAVGLSTLPLAQAGFDGKNGVEEALEARARALGKPHSGLETAEQQLSLFDELPAAVQGRYLDDVITHLPGIGDKLAAMVEAWRLGDAERLAALMNEDESDPVLLERLLLDRNKTWAEWIEERMKRPGTVFVAVGAGHLAGPGSVQDQLAARRVAVRRVQ